MSLTTIKEITTNILNKHNLKLYSIKTKKEFGENIIEILIDNQITHDQLEPIHLEILDAINDEIPDGYLLEISTVGPERQLHNLQEIIDHIGQYIYLKSDKFSGDAKLINVEDNNLTIQYFEKGKPQKLIIAYENISFIRQAIKI